jgi:hypothetical protein
MKVHSGRICLFKYIDYKWMTKFGHRLGKAGNMALKIYIILRSEHNGILYKSSNSCAQYRDIFPTEF